MSNILINSGSGNRTYSKSEFNSVMINSMQQVFLMYQMSCQRNVELKKRLHNALNGQVAQVGGANGSYSKKELNKLINNSIQQLVFLYQQSHNKNMHLKNQLRQLLGK